MEIWTPWFYTLEMSIGAKRLLKHMAWANQQVYQAVQTLPAESLESFLVNEEWTAKQILEHITSGADWYLYCLRGGNLQEIGVPSNMSDVANLAKMLGILDNEIIELGQLNDEMLTITYKGQTEKNLRSTIISQTVHHATEHRTQLIAALEFKGYKPIILDNIDLWAFESLEGDLM